jgi:hypothetical protein
MSVTAKAYLNNDKYIKVSVDCKSSDILECLQKKHICTVFEGNSRASLVKASCTTIPKKMLEHIDNFFKFINKLNDDGIICIKKDPDNEDTFISLGFNIIIIVNIEGWVSAIKEGINNKIFGAPSSVYEMLSRLGFAPKDGESSSGPLYSDIKSRKSRLAFLKDIWIYSDDKSFTNMHRLWNSNISGVDTIRTNTSYKNKSRDTSDTSDTRDTSDSDDNAKRQKKESSDTSNLQLLCSLV